MKKADLTGKRYGRLTVLGDVKKRGADGRILWPAVSSLKEVPPEDK